MHFLARWPSRFALLGALGAGGCAASEPLSREEFSRQFEELLCGGARSCCAQGSHGFDESDCRAQVEYWQSYFDFQSHPQLDLTFDPHQAGLCLEMLRRSREGCTEFSERLFNTQCTTIYHGLLTRGESCQRQDQCGRADDGTLMACYTGVRIGELPPTCQPTRWTEAERAKTRQIATVGGACDGDRVIKGEEVTYVHTRSLDLPPVGSVGYVWCPVEQGAHCDRDSRCSLYPGLGEDCFGTFCATGLICNDRTFRCEPRQPEGGACVSDECMEWTYCDATRHCAPRRWDGEACSEVSACRSSRCVDGLCRAKNDLTHDPTSCID